MMFAQHMNSLVVVIQKIGNSNNQRSTALEKSLATTRSSIRHTNLGSTANELYNIDCSSFLLNLEILKNIQF
jgi:hypothetical protein